MSTNVLQFKIATEDWEFEQIHRAELPDFCGGDSAASTGRTAASGGQVPRGEHLPCLPGRRRVVGMLAARGRRPFRWTKSCPTLNSFLPPGRRPCEMRLLAVEKEYRNSAGFRGIIALMWQYGTERGDSIWPSFPARPASRSFTGTWVLSLLGPLVGKGEAMFPADVLTLEGFEKKAEEFFSHAGPSAAGRPVFFPARSSIQSA